MKKYDSDEIYEVEINNEIYCFQYPDPETRNGGKSFSGVAIAWKKGTNEIFTVPYRVRAEDIDTVYFKIVERIKAHIEG